ncbi:MAG: hypothetical protein VKK63_10220 [Synechococcus sp.]|nr:hypothetical protein [Synechococcus sp.]
MKPNSVRKIAIIGDYLPRKCGIATFSHSVCRALSEDTVTNECFIVAVNDLPEGYAYPPEVRFEIAEQDLTSYRRAADFLNLTDTDVICLQHEFGIYGGPAGSHILTLLRHVQIPVVTQLHTVLEEPSIEQLQVMKELAALSARIIVMSERGRQILEDI